MTRGCASSPQVECRSFVRSFPWLGLPPALSRNDHDGRTDLAATLGLAVEFVYFGLQSKSDPAPGTQESARPKTRGAASLNDPDICDFVIPSEKKRWVGPAENPTLIHEREAAC